MSEREFVDSSLAIQGRTCRRFPSERNQSIDGKNAYLIDYHALHTKDEADRNSSSYGPLHLFISRYDARALLDEATLSACEGSFSTGFEDSDCDANEDIQEINNERYRYFPGWNESSDEMKFEKGITENEIKSSEKSDNDEDDFFKVPNAPKGIQLVSETIKMNLQLIMDIKIKYLHYVDL